MNVQRKLILALLVSQLTVLAQGTVSHHGSILYRQASLSVRGDSVFYKDTQDRNYVDQFYASLGLRKTGEYLNLVHVEPVFFTRRTNPNELEFSLDQAYFQAQLSPSITLLTGRKTEYRGSGYTINPSDVMNESKDVMDPVNQRLGQVMTRVDIAVGHDFSLGIGFLREAGEDFDSARGWLLITGYALGGEMVLQGRFHHSEKSTLGLSYSKFMTDEVEVHVDAKYQSRQRPAEDFPERNFSALKYEDQSIAAVVGMRLALPSRFSVIGEWYRNESGLTPSEMSTYFADLLTTKALGQTIQEPNTRPIGQSYLHLAVHGDQLTDSLRGVVSLLTNTADSSTYLSGELKYYVSPFLQVSYSPLLFMGAAGSEFGEMPTSAAHFLNVQGSI